MDEPLEQRVDSLNFMLAAWGGMMTIAGAAIYAGLENIEREDYDSINMMNLSDWTPHFFIAAGIPMIISYNQSKYGYAAAFVMGALNIAHELAQHYGVIAGGLQIEDIVAGTVGALGAVAVTKYAYRT